MAKTKDMRMIAVGLLVVSIIAVAGIFYYAVNYKPASFTIPPPQTEWDLNLPLKFLISDKWQGDMCGSADSISKTIYDMNGNQIEAITAGTTVQTTQIYTPGVQVWVKLSVGATGINGGTETYFKYYKITIPHAPSSDATTHDIKLEYYTAGTYNLLVNYPNGTSVTTNSPSGTFKRGYGYDMAGASSTLYPSFTVQVIENITSHDYGFMTTEDPVYGVTREATVVMRLWDYNATCTAAAALLCNSVPLIYSSSSTDKYYAQVIDPQYLIRDTLPDGSVKSAGIYSMSLTFNGAGVTANTWTCLQLNLYMWDNLNYFKTYGTHPVGYESTDLCASFYMTITG